MGGGGGCGAGVRRVGMVGRQTYMDNGHVCFIRIIVDLLRH